MKKLRVTIEGKTYEVLVEEIGGTDSQAPLPPAAHAPIASAVAGATVAAQSPSPAASASSAPAPAGEGDVVCPLSGRVVSLDCAVGQSVEVGDRLVTVEAMKMNTYVQAQAAGTVAAILVKVGDPVEEGQSLLTLK